MNPNSPTQHDIALRAWELWHSRGQPGGQDVAIWLEAERQLSTPADANKTPPVVEGRRNGKTGPVPPAGSKSVDLKSRAGPESQVERLRGEMASESEVEFQITPAPTDDEAIKAALQKRDARAPQRPVKDAPQAKPAETGKPLWSKPHSS